MTHCQGSDVLYRGEKHTSEKLHRKKKKKKKKGGGGGGRLPINSSQALVLVCDPPPAGFNWPTAGFIGV